MPLYEVIAALIKRLKELSLVDASSSTTNIIQQLTGNIVPGIQGSDGEDGPIGPQGLKGNDGSMGTGGPAGPVTVGPMGLNGEDGEDGFPIPGNIGLTGSQGIQGPQGPITLGPMGMDGEDGADGYPIPGPAGTNGTNGSPAWTLVATQVCAGAANYDFVGLAAYSEFIVIIDGVALSTNAVTSLRVSINNGSTFLTSYFDIATSGAAGGSTEIAFYSGNSAAARYGRIHIEFANTACVYKTVQSFSGTNTFISTASPINALRVLGTAGNLNSGSIYVLAR